MPELESPTDAHQMFSTLMRALLQHLPRSVWGDIRRLVVLAWAVVALCLTKKVSLPGLSEVVESRARYPASHTRRFARWFDNPHVQVQDFYAPLVRAALADWQPSGRLYVALDVSVLKGSPFVLARASLIYRGRAIPLAWQVLEHASASVAFMDYVAVLEQVQALLPAGLEVVLLADRGFVHAELIQWLGGSRLALPHSSDQRYAGALARLTESARRTTTPAQGQSALLPRDSLVKCGTGTLPPRRCTTGCTEPGALVCGQRRAHRCQNLGGVWLAL